MERKTDLDALDRLREQFERNVRPYDYTTALHHAYPAIAAELREARKRVRELEAEIEVRDNSANETLRILREAMPNRGFHSEMEAAEAAAKEVAELREELNDRTMIAARAQESLRLAIAGEADRGAVWAAYGNADSARSWLDARDRHTKLIGAAEELERSAKTLREAVRRARLFEEIQRKEGNGMAKPQFGQKKASELMALVSADTAKAREMLAIVPWARPSPWSRFTDAEIEEALAGAGEV